jgi:hypothetical protein
MTEDLSTVSLYDRVSTTGFAASILTTYNCWFPFYEHVVLRRLLAAGCTHNVLFADATRCAEAMASDELRPRLAGSAYTLIPVRMSGAFHPKLQLQLGRAKGALCVGSHNVTFAGFGLNDELTNAFELDAKRDRSQLGIFQAAAGYLRSFIPATLPEVGRACEAALRVAPWLAEEAPGAEDVTFAGATGSGVSLWDVIRPHLPVRPRRALVVAPFFDAQLRLLDQLVAEIAPRELIVAIDPETAEIDVARATAFRGGTIVSVHDALPVPNRREGAHPYLHAKLLWFDTGEGEVLVTGSANASVAAFLGGPHRRNAEAVIVRKGRGFRKQLGLEALLGAPQLSAAQWKALGARRAAAAAVTVVEPHPVRLAELGDDGFHVEGHVPLGTSATVVDAHGQAVGPAKVVDAGPAARLTADEAAYTRAASIMLRLEGREEIALVHRVRDVERHLVSDLGRDLRRALGAIDEDPTQIDALVKLAEKVIFDDAAAISEGGAPLGMHRKKGASTDVPPPKSSLAVNAVEGATKRTKSIASGDIVVLLDALVRRLGEGLEVERAAPLLTAAREEQVGLDEENGGEIDDVGPDYGALANACRAKVRRLSDRMVGQLEKAKTPAGARRAVVQLAAVLGILRALRIAELRPEWQKERLDLLHRDALAHLLDRATALVGHGADAILARAVDDAAGGPFEEASMAVGLLAWLAWEVGVDVEHGPSGYEDDDYDAALAWGWVQSIGWIAEPLASDSSAQRLLRDGIERASPPGAGGAAWVQRTLGFVRSIVAALENADHVGERRAHPAAGDLVALPSRFIPRVRLAVEVSQGSRGFNVAVADPDMDEGVRRFEALAVRTLPRMPAKVSPP